MPTVVQDLASIPALRVVAVPELASSAPHWQQRELRPQAVLWEEGETADGLALLVAGELAVEAQGALVGRVWAGEVLGEAATILKAHARTATIRSVTLSRVLLLDTLQLGALRGTGGGLYDALLNLAEHVLVRRIHDADLQVARIAGGTEPAPIRPHPSALARLWTAIHPRLPQTPCPPIEPLLWIQPALGSATAITIAAIALGFTRQRVAAGTVLFLEGEPGGSAWLIAEGEVEVWRNVRHGKAEWLATLGPGRLLGVNALVERGARTASCIAVTPSWLYRMDGIEGYRHLHGAQLRAWRESLVGSLTSQIRTADHLLGTTLRPTVVQAAADEVLSAYFTDFTDSTGDVHPWVDPVIAEVAPRSSYAQAPMDHPSVL